jgi:hypothetical protein
MIMAQFLTPASNDDNAMTIPFPEDSSLAAAPRIQQFPQSVMARKRPCA